MYHSPKYLLYVLAFTTLPFSMKAGVQDDSIMKEDYGNEAAVEKQDKNVHPDINYSELSIPLSQQNRAIGKEQWQKLSSDPIFRYQEEKLQPQPQNRNSDWWMSILAGIYRFFTSAVGKIIVWLLVSVLVLILLFRIFKLKGNIFFSRKDKKIATQQADEDSDDFVPDNWEIAIADAVQQNNYRLAVRYSYRYLLSLLQEKEMIQYEKAKTNYAYGRELANTSFHKTFLQMTLHYEYAWYGEFEVGQLEFEHYYQLITQIKAELS